MLNIERYKEELIKAYSGGGSLGETIIYVMKIHDIRYPGTILDWLCSEYKEPVLTEKEKEYLSNVIKPFKDRVIYICKASIGDTLYQIEIYYKEEDGDKDVIALPIFNAGTMYKGMQMDSYYDLEELGLC